MREEERDELIVSEERRERDEGCPTFCCSVLAAAGSLPGLSHLSLAGGERGRTTENHHH